MHTTLELAGKVNAPDDVEKIGHQLQIRILSQFLIQQAFVDDIHVLVHEQAALYDHLRLEKIAEPTVLNPLEGTYTQGVYSESLARVQADLKAVLRKKYDIVWRLTVPLDGFSQRVSVQESQLPWLDTQDYLEVNELQLIEHTNQPNITKVSLTGGSQRAKATAR